ncbi:hypothetical protein [Streptacidiphilus rugosus]|uniref:hypothetical protein n=1 Tax=Streptacidiphilus rugosus TaxID=405783 RepID=UPI00069023FE|nr:hypothetical protein [Streptacidiphilus rugosus]
MAVLSEGTHATPTQGERPLRGTDPEEAGPRRSVRHSGRSWRPRASVPARLRQGTALCLLLTVVLGLLGLSVAVGAQSTWTAVGSQQAPQVLDATGLYQALTDLDAQSANLIMFGADPALAANRADALKAFSADRTAADRDLQQATLAAAGSPSVQRALADVLDGMGRYQDLDGRALALNDAGHRPAGQPSPDALTDYRQATDLMRGTLLPAADRLVTANNDAYNRSYDAERSALGTGLWWLLTLGAALLAALIGLQVWLSARFRRRVNPALAAATLLAVLFLALAGSLCTSQREDLRAARRDAFDSVVALSRARADAYDANADESRYLLDSGRAAQYQDAFETESQLIAALPGTSLPDYDARLADAVTAYHGNHGDIRFGGFLGAEFHNVTFPGERAAAERTLAAYQLYERDDRTIRALAGRGRLHDAIAYGTSYAPGASNAAFAAQDTALQQVISINTTAFDHSIDQARGELSTRVPLLAAAAALILLLCLLGVRPRLAEFRR